MEKGTSLKVELIMYNMKNLTTKGIEELTKCKVLEVDFNGGATNACIKFRIKGVLNGMRAIINTARSGEAVDLYFKQALDNYDKLRTIFINNAPPDIRNITLWKESLRNELGVYGTVVEVFITKRIVTATFSRPREAFYFERNPVSLSIAGCDVIATRTPFTTIRSPFDVIVEGFYNDDAEETLEAVAAEAGPLNRVEIVSRKDRGALVISFPNHSKAEDFVRRRKLELERGNSNISNEVTIEWGKDNNTRKTTRKEENDPTNTDSTSVLAKLTALDNKLREDKKAGVTEFKRLEKERLRLEKIREQERKEDQLCTMQMIADSQNRVLSVVGNTLTCIADKQATIDCITDELADYRGERQLINFQLMITNAEADPTKTTLSEALMSRREILNQKISELQEKRNSTVSRKIDVPALPSPTLIPLTLPSPTNKEVSTQKRKIEVISVPPHRETVDQLTDLLKGNENRSVVSTDIWHSIFEDVIQKNIMKMGEVWTFLLPIGIAEKELVIGKFQAFAMVFQGTPEAKTAETIADHLERAVVKEKEAADKKNKK